MTTSINSSIELAQAVDNYGLLPFFRSPVPGLSLQELSPGTLFDDDNGGYGCWDWKGPVIREMQCAYGKFFRRKAGFVSRSLLPDFLNMRRAAYSIADGSVEQMILDIIRARQGCTSSELRKIIFSGVRQGSRHSLEAPLQKLQMAGLLLIADFQYKLDRHGNRYGWGVALYSTPEIWFDGEITPAACSPAESCGRLRDHLRRISTATDAQIASLL